MAVNISGLIEQLQAFAPELIGCISAEFSSNTPGHRAAIRDSISKSLPTLSQLECDQLGDLAFVPNLEHWSVSISHCHEAGGWIAVPRPMQVGLDLEVRDRIHDKIVARIANPGELDGIPTASYLWGAKEAYFKALSKDQPVVVTQLYIDSWKSVPNRGFTFSGKSSRQGHGLIVENGTMLVSVCLV